MLALAHPFDPSPSDVGSGIRASSSSSRSRVTVVPPRMKQPASSSSHSSSSTSTAPSVSAGSSLTKLSYHRQHSSSSSNNTSSNHRQHLQLKPAPPPPQPPKLTRSVTPPSVEPVVAPQPTSSSVPTAPPVDIHTFPSNDLLRLLASLLTQIAATNDKLDAASSIPDPTPSTSSPSSPTQSHLEQNPFFRHLTTASKSAVCTQSSTLTFHARNIPTISLEAYLLRILKYCPTTNEVFLSLLVYFDRMSKLNADATGRVFVIDSYNIHRLVIAGVTVASKFFSDVFYTNSRYAKVGGLPQSELNQLELQFLLLNDFSLVIPQTEMQRYAEQLVLFSKSSSGPKSEGGAHLPVVSGAAPGPTGPSQTMGAFDVFGGRVASDDSYHRPPPSSGAERSGKFAEAGPQEFTRTDTSTSTYALPIPPRMVRENNVADTETETETETEGETETDTDAGDSTTDDEPTIRAAQSCGGSSYAHSISSASSHSHAEEDLDARSIRSFDTSFSEDSASSRLGDDEAEADDGDDMDFTGEADGEKTPEKLSRGRDSVELDTTPEIFGVKRAKRDRLADFHMASP